MEVRRRSWRFGAPLAAALLVAVQMFNWAPLANAQKAGDPVELRGFATGQPVHVGALEMAGTRVVNAEVAWSAAAVDADADGLKGAKLNEVNRIFQPNKAGKLSYARGSGVEVGLVTTPTDPNQVIVAGLAEAAAAPSSKKDEQIEVPGDPAVYASLARGNAVANANESGLVPDVCVLGDDLSRGLGYVADATLLDAGGDTQSPQMDAPLIALDDVNPTRSVSNSVSRERLVPTGKPDNFGLMSEVRQTIAPVTLVADRTNPAAPRQVTIEILGEWVLRVVATGGGGSQVFYGPGKVNPQSHILRIIDSASTTPLELTFQQIFGNTGVQLPPDLAQLIQLSVGEDPRAIAKPGANPDPDSKPTITPTKVSAAVDVVRVRLLAQPDPIAADIRIGHMEAEAEVPAGGINCPIPVTKVADPDNIRIKESPDTSHITITVHNVYSCDLVNTVLTDAIRQKEGDPDFQLTTASPAADSPDMPTGNLRTADVVWSLGTIPKGTTKAVTLDLKSATSGGVIRDIATAVGKMANCTGSDEAGLAVAGLAIAGLNISGLSIPVDVSIEIPRTGANARNTVATGAGLALLAVAASVVMRRRGRRLGRNSS